MAYYPVVQKNDRPVATVGRHRLPTFYMEDFSILGFRVNDCERAVRILDRHDYELRRTGDGVEVAIETLARVPAVIQLLNENGLGCEIADIAVGMYQG